MPPYIEHNLDVLCILQAHARFTLFMEQLISRTYKLIFISLQSFEDTLITIYSSPVTLKALLTTSFFIILIII